MFVRQSKYDECERKLYTYMVKYSKLLDKYNYLIDIINEKGGQDFLDGNVKDERLNQEDIKRLLMLCHPDKHDGKQIAVAMTQKLLELRD